MKLDDLLLMDFTGKTVVVGGYPGSGKTYIAKKLCEQHAGSRIIHTDDYKDYGFKESLYELMKDIPKQNNGTLFIEGVLFARLLRKGQELSSFAPDVVIIVERDEESIFDYYIDKGEEHKIPDVKRFFKNLDTVYTQYLNENIIEPEFITVYNNDF